MNTKTKTVKALKVLLGAASLALFSATGHALVLSSATPSSVFNWSFVGTNGSTSYTLTGNGSFLASGFNSNSLTLNIVLNNTTIVPSGSNAGLYSFGFGIDPNATSVSFSDASDGGMNGAVLSTQQGSTQIPSLNNIEVCAFGQTNCSGGSQLSAIAAGSSDSFALILAGTWGSSVTIDPIGFKYQTSIGSFEFYSSSGSTSSTSTSGEPPNAPEPNSLALLGLGLIASVFVLRRRSLQASLEA